MTRGGTGSDRFICEQTAAIDGLMTPGFLDHPCALTTILDPLDNMGHMAGRAAGFAGHWNKAVLFEYGLPILTRDMVTNARTGQVALTLQSFNDFKVLRIADFVMLKNAAT